MAVGLRRNALRRNARLRLAGAGALAAYIGAAGAARAADVVSTFNPGGGSRNWGSSASWSNSPPVNHFPNNGNGGFTYDAVVNTGSLTLDQNITIQKLNWTGGNLFGEADLTLNELLTWSGGTFDS